MKKWVQGPNPALSTVKATEQNKKQQEIETSMWGAVIGQKQHLIMKTKEKGHLRQREMWEKTEKAGGKKIYSTEDWDEPLRSAPRSHGGFSTEQLSIPSTGHLENI